LLPYFFFPHFWRLKTYKITLFSNFLVFSFFSFLAKLRQYENENTASLKVFFIRLSSSLHLRARERREMHTHTTNFLHVANYFCVRARERERERERDDDDDDELSSRRRAVESNARASGGEEFRVLGYLLADLVMRQSSLSIFFTVMADRCNETPESSSKKSHMAHARHRERERERECYWIRIRSPVFVFMAKFRTPKKSSAKRGYRRRSVWRKKKKKHAKVAVFCVEKKSDVAIFRE
jgi:hypothetical protein